ncbi:MAG: Endo,4-beta-xylanase precursor [Verrucomicrobiota bacterium]
MSFGPIIASRPPLGLRPWILAVLFLMTGFLPSRGAPWRWYWSNPLPHGNNIADFAYHTNHHFVQVTDHGQAYFSDTLVRWDSRDTGTRHSLRGATFLGDRLIISAERGLILWSDDFFRFQQVDLLTENWLESVAASPVRAVAVGDNAAVYLSDDGIRWQLQPVPFTNWLHGVAWGGNVFAAVGDDGLIVTSPDGVEWTSRSVADGNNAGLNRIAWTGNGFVVAGDQFAGSATVIFGNSSGTSWVRQTQSAATGNLLAAAAESPSSRLVTGDFEVRLASGSSVIFWSDQTAPPDGAPPAEYLAAISDGRQYLLGGRTGLTVSSQVASPFPEETQWKAFPSPPRNWLFDVTTARAVSTNVTFVIKDGEVLYRSAVLTNQFYVACGDLATLVTSDTGITWGTSLPPASASNQVYLAIAGNDRGLVSVGSAGTLSFSPVAYETLISTNRISDSTDDLGQVVTNHVTVTNEVNTLGVAWYEMNSTTNLDLLAACANPELYVVAGQGGFVASSPDGTNWTAQVSGSTATLSGLTPWAGGFVAVGDEGTILTSPDAVTWTPRPSGTTNWLFRVHAGPRQLIAVGRNGTLLTSSDSFTWTPRNSGVTNALNDVTRVAGVWFVAGNQGTLLSSTNTVDWALDDQIITGKSLFGLTSRGVQLLTVGIEGIILRTRVTPYPNPMTILDYPKAPEDRVFVFRGELDQRFRLDRGTAVNTLIKGPVLNITDPSGLLLYLDPSTHDLPAQIFAAPTDP